MDQILSAHIWVHSSPNRRRELLKTTRESIEATHSEPEKLTGWDNDLETKYNETEFESLPEWLQSALAFIL